MDGTNIFTVTPMNYNVELAPGQEYSDKIVIANPAGATQDFDYRVTISPYAVIGEDYTADFLTKTGMTQLTDWVTIENPDGTLKPNETATVKFTIKVPETASPGGQYAALLVSSSRDVDENEGVAINNVFEMASIIYANIDGEITHGGGIIDNSVPGFVTAVPIQTSATFINNGNTHEIAQIGLEVRSVFSATKIYPRPGESGSINEVIMPETSRYVTRDITGISSLGIYEVTQTIDYLGENNQIKRVVVACPVWFMLLVTITVAILILSIVYRVKIHRRKRRAL